MADDTSVPFDLNLLSICFGKNVHAATFLLNYTKVIRDTIFTNSC